MAFIVMAFCIALEVVLFFAFAPDPVGIAAGVMAAAMIAAVLVWVPIYFDLI